MRFVNDRVVNMQNYSTAHSIRRISAPSPPRRRRDGYPPRPRLDGRLRATARITPWVIALLLVFQQPDVQAQGTADRHRFVATNGSDTAPGTEAAPWRTLQHAADHVVAGDVVEVHSGHYAGFQLTRSGAADNTIIFRGEEGAVIDSPHPGDDGINLEGASYIVIEGFTVTGATRAGIRSVINHHVTIRKNHTDQNGMWGIFAANSDFIVIEDNVTSRSRVEHGIYVSSATDHALVRGNSIWGNHVNGIHLNSGKGALLTAARVEGNIIYDNGAGGGSGINADGIQSSLIQNNLLYGNHGSGISLYRDTGDKAAWNNAVLNNTVVQAADGRWALNIQNASIGSAVYNNILLHENKSRGSISIALDCLPGLRSNHNIVTNRFTTDRGNSRIDMLQWRTATKNDRDSIVAAPRELFVDSLAHDYRLRENSPAVGAGASYRTPAVDLAGNSRPPRQSDIGAYQRKTDHPANRKELDRDGPQLIQVTPAGQILPPLNRFRLQFSEELRHDTLTEKTVKVMGPQEEVAILGIEPDGTTDYLINVAPIKVPGPYAILLDTGIQDPAGNPLNQLGNSASQTGVRQFIVRFQIVDSYKFSFGPRTAPASEGFIRVTENTGYDPSRGFGWLNGGVRTVDNGEGSSETRSLAYGPLLHFAVDVPAGDYDVTLTLGNSKYAHDQMALALQGAPTESINSAVGQFHVQTYRVAVTNGHFDLVLQDRGGSDPNAVINSLVVAPVLDGPHAKTASLRQEKP